MKITWIGHSCFKLEKEGYSVITDPYAPGSVPGLASVDETADLVLCSHEHSDHGYRAGVRIVKGTSASPQIQAIASWHDEVKGAKRGPNTIYRINFTDESVVHLGDIGCDLTSDEMKPLMDADVLLIPIGGFYTIGPRQAASLVKALRPRFVIPMHYRDDRMGFGYDVIGTSAEFVREMGVKANTVGSLFSTDDLHAEQMDTQLILMTPQNAVK